MNNPAPVGTPKTRKPRKKKGSDYDIIRLNSVGISLSTIAKALKMHPSSITNRLNSLNIKPADTRRSFMEDVFMSLHPDQQEWIADQLGPTVSIKDYVKKLFVEEYTRKNMNATTSNN